MEAYHTAWINLYENYIAYCSWFSNVVSSMGVWQWDSPFPGSLSGAAGTGHVINILLYIIVISLER